MNAADRVRGAFAELAKQPGYRSRPDQEQLALLISDCIEHEKRGAFEAPTGLGKSLASLIPAIANAIASGKRTVIATYTNVLAEQYWRSDMPMARSLFGDSADSVETEFLIGRARYACKAAMAENPSVDFESFVDSAELGVESDYRQWAHAMGGRDRLKLWPQIAVPPVCPARQCPFYEDCFYYRRRRSAEKAHVIITNHSVVLQDALLRQASQSEQSMLGNYDFLILDEAHDFVQAAQNSLEFEITEAKADQMLALAQRLHELLLPGARKSGDGEALMQAWLTFADAFRRAAGSLRQLAPATYDAALLRVAPAELTDHPAVQKRYRPDLQVGAQALAGSLAEIMSRYLVRVRLQRDLGESAELARSHLMYLEEFAEGCRHLFDQDRESAEVAFVDGGEFRPVRVRRDVVDLAAVLKPLIWDIKPWACLSATLALDGDFGYFRRSSGAAPDFTEILPSPFDFRAQAALYVPPVGRVMDSAEARKSQRETEYWQRLADEIGRIIEACRGRTLALFASRKDMEEVHRRLPPLETPVLIQRAQGAAATGDRFRRDIASSLFALRSFWTGFDAPGETCFCVVVTRVPFEPPTDPVALARMVWMQRQGHDPFLNHTLPQAKMLMRQGTGRLIRRTTDRGIIALLDPRLRTKSYGEQIFENLPPDMRSFDDIQDAVAHVESS